MITDDRQRTRSRAATLALGATIVLTAGKIIVGSISQSAGVISEGIHSGLDLVSAATAFYTIREAGKPADDEHPYGHGKFETLSSLVEALLLVAAAVFIFNEAYDHWKNPTPLVHGGLAIATMAISLVLSVVLYIHNSRAAAATDSSAIRVNALHFLADAVTAIGVLVALVLIEITGAPWLDPLVALLVGIYILVISWKQVVGSVSELIDHRLPMAEIQRIETILESMRPQMIEAHELKTRKSGSTRHLDFHLLLCGKMSVNESHEICDTIEARIESEFPQSQVTIHVEPCAHSTHQVGRNCPKSPDRVCEFRSEGKKPV